MLPVSWSPIGVKGLIRVGPNEDGGYVLPLPLLKSTDMLLGFGLSTDWRFEEEFRGRSGCKVECYDHTINPAFWRRKVVTDSAGFLAGPQRFTWSKFRYMLKYREYRRFFSRPEVIHHQLKVGYDGDGSVSLKTILARITTESVFLKIDIEGWEYRIMEDLVNTPDNVLGFVMELHDIDLHRDRISAFIEKLGSFSVVHLHANNGGGTDPGGDPLVVEITFARSALVEVLPEPHRDYPIAGLDYANAPSMPDLPLRFG